MATPNRYLLEPLPGLEGHAAAKHWGPAFEELWSVAQRYDGQVPRKESSVSVDWPSVLVGVAAGVALAGWFYFAMFVLVIAFFVWA